MSQEEAKRNTYSTSKDAICGISWITVTYNSLGMVDHFVNSLSRFLGDGDEIIVVDEMSTDETRQWLRKTAGIMQGLKLIQSSTNKGWRSGVNEGIMHATNEIVVISNPDIIVPRDFDIESLIKYLYNKEVGIVFPRVIEPNQKQIMRCLYIDIPSLIGHWEPDRPSSRIALKAEIPLGCFFISKKSVLKQAGGLYEDVSMYGGEEEELGVKMQEMGLKIIYYQSTFVYHMKGQSVKRLKSPISFVISNSYRARVILYYRLYSDSKINRIVWWMLFLIRSVMDSLHLRSSVPLSTAAELYRKRKSLISYKKGIKPKWRPLTALQTLLFYLRATL